MEITLTLKNAMSLQPAQYEAIKPEVAITVTFDPEADEKYEKIRAYAQSLLETTMKDHVENSLKQYVDAKNTFKEGLN